ncbi:MAG: hypothetical protein WBF53_14000 [Litorimonas sp.]
MTHRFALPVLALLLAACSGSDPATRTSEAAQTSEAPTDVLAPAEIPVLEESGSASSAFLEDGAVVLTVDRLIAEDSACLVMMSVVNGLEEPANAGVFAFSVTGNGVESGGNMFPQTAAPGDTTTAQIVLPGADCDNVQVIEDGQLNCTLPDSDGKSCLADLELRDNAVQFGEMAQPELESDLPDPE